MSVQPSPPSTIPVLFTVADVVEMTRLSRSKVYELLAAGVIRSVSVGRSRRIPADALAEFIDSLSEQS